MNIRLLVYTASLLALAGCAGYGHSGHEHRAGSAMGNMPKAPQVSSAASTMFQDGMLVAANGMTLYTFDKDQTDSSNCYDACAVKWPPYYAMPMAQASGDFGIINRSDGRRQWTYRNKPLYFWQMDQKPGDASGDNVGGVWHIVKP